MTAAVIPSNSTIFANKGQLCRIKCEQSSAICESFRQRRLRSRRRADLAKGFDSVMISHWAKWFMQSTIFQPTIFFGESNGLAALATTQAFQAILYPTVLLEMGDALFHRSVQQLAGFRGDVLTNHVILAPRYPRKLRLAPDTDQSQRSQQR